MSWFGRMAWFGMALVGCASGQPGAQVPTPATSAAPSRATTANGAAPERPLGQATVSLLDPGKEPRRPLRYAFTMKPERLVLDMKMQMKVSIGAQTAPEVGLPTVRTVLDVTPTRVSKDGDLSYDGQISREEVVPDGDMAEADRAALENQLASIVGMKIHSTVTARGVVTDATMDVPDGTAPQLRRMLESMRDSLRGLSSPLPVEPVGVGAIWRVDVAIKTGFRLEQSSVFTLKAIDGASADFDLKLRETAKPQPVVAQVPTSDTHITLESFTGTGTGTMKTYFDRVAPVSNVSSDTSMHLVIEQAGQKTPTHTDLHVELGVRQTPS
jgi:hypothetical protein